MDTKKEIGGRARVRKGEGSHTKALIMAKWQKPRVYFANCALPG